MQPLISLCSSLEVMIPATPLAALLKKRKLTQRTIQALSWKALTKIVVTIISLFPLSVKVLKSQRKKRHFSKM